LGPEPTLISLTMGSLPHNVVSPKVKTNVTNYDVDKTIVRQLHVVDVHIVRSNVNKWRSNKVVATNKGRCRNRIT
jgi:hypothetical protein